jgi:hypothetical protein
MIDRSGVFLALAAASVLVPATFIVAIVVAAVQRWRGLDVGPRFNALLALLGAASLGTLVLFLPDPVVAAPILGATALLVILSWRGRRRVQAGWIVIGAALPWTALWTVYLIALAAGARFEPGATWQGFLLGAVPLAAGLVIAARGDADSTQRAGTVEAKRSGRTFHDVSTAIGALDMLGPFRLPSLAALVALVASWIVIPLALGPFVPAPSRSSWLQASPRSPQRRPSFEFGRQRRGAPSRRSAGLVSGSWPASARPRAGACR